MKIGVNELYNQIITELNNKFVQLHDSSKEMLNDQAVGTRRMSNGQGNAGNLIVVKHSPIWSKVHYPNICCAIISFMICVHSLYLFL